MRDAHGNAAPAIAMGAKGLQTSGMNDLTTKRTAFVVLGMHRSGTSSVAGVLALLGATPPRTLMGPKPENPKGFWESEVLMAFNDEILTRAGSAWDDPAPLDQGVFDGAQGDDLRGRARKKLDEEFGDADTIVIKDPRICRFYPFWRDVLVAAGYEPFVILPLRDPAEVATSLQARNGMPIESGLKLWRRHVEDAERTTRGQRRRVIVWSQFLENWRDEIASINSECGNILRGADKGVDEFLALPKKIRERNVDIDSLTRATFEDISGLMK